ncbi:hypothetical protein K0B04_01785 [Patescibacteria group bacterium]|nr:hypothetical protein [Patescibacteria group bacterium]
MKIFKKAKNKKEENILLALSILLVILFVLIFACIVIESLNTSEVKILTDKRRYKEGDIIKITVLNDSDKSITYSSGFDAVWGIQRLKKGEWDGSEEIIFGEKGRFFLKNKSADSNGRCFISNNSVAPLNPLAPSEIGEFEWDQMGCLATSRGLETSLKRAKRGTYRIYLEYSYGSVDENGDRVLISDTAYSRPFSIR